MRSPQGAVAINKGQSPVHDHTPPQQAQQQEADDDDDERELWQLQERPWGTMIARP
jgi:hypothetical protein